MSAEYSRSNEAPAFLPGKRGSDPPAHAHAPGRFNEAPAFLPGKSFLRVGLRLEISRASMRPRHFCRGRERRRHRSRAPRHGFNEAPAFLPGKSIQNGEMNDEPTRASMRPRHFCRGRAPRCWRRCASGPASFNEAPAFLPGKRHCWAGNLSRPDGCFNEAPAFLPGKRLAADAERSEIELLQ